jgi:ketosteroid isomerase-like protein
MRKIFLVLVIVLTALFISISCDGTIKPANSANNAPANTTAAPVNHEADVKKLIADLATTLSNNDFAALDKIYANDYTLVTQNGDITNKAERIAQIKSGDLKFENVAFSDVKVRSYGDTAVAIANSSGKNILKGKTTTTNFRITFVANKTKDGWRLVSAQLTSLPEATKSDDSNKPT